jgi:hypothetical protein
VNIHRFFAKMLRIFNRSRRAFEKWALQGSTTILTLSTGMWITRSNCSQIMIIAGKRVVDNGITPYLLILL